MQPGPSARTREIVRELVEAVHESSDDEGRVPPSEDPPADKEIVQVLTTVPQPLIYAPSAFEYDSESADE